MRGATPTSHPHITRSRTRPDYGRPKPAAQGQARPTQPCDGATSLVLESRNNNCATRITTTSTPTYMVCRAARKIAAKRYALNTDSRASLSRESPPGPGHGCPHVFGLNARLHAFSFGDMDMIDLRTRSWPAPGYPPSANDQTREVGRCGQPVYRRTVLRPNTLGGHDGATTPRRGPGGGRRAARKPRAKRHFLSDTPPPPPSDACSIALASSTTRFRSSSGSITCA